MVKVYKSSRQIDLEHQQALSEVEKNQTLVDSFKQDSQGTDGGKSSKIKARTTQQSAQIASKREAVADHIEAIKEDKDALV